MKVTYLGTTMLLFDDGVDQLLFDCHTTRPSLLTAFARKLKTDTSVADRVLRDHPMDRLQAMFLSHSHYDHVLDIPYYAKKTGCQIYGSASTANVALGGGVDESRIHVFAHGGEYAIGKFKVRVIASRHSKPGFYNNDLGQTIDNPLSQPARMRAFKEGGSYDFLVEHEQGKFLIRPSYNFIAGQLEGITADVLFLGVTKFYKDPDERKALFFAETIAKVRPQVVIPLHWDNFFKPLYGTTDYKKSIFDKPEKSFRELTQLCESKGCEFRVVQPLNGYEFGCNK